MKHLVQIARHGCFKSGSCRLSFLAKAYTYQKGTGNSTGDSLVYCLLRSFSNNVCSKLTLTTKKEMACKDFDDFVCKLRNVIDQNNGELPGEEAHLKMLPGSRKRVLASMKEVRDKNPRESAVLVLFYPINGIPHFCLTQRNSYDGVHSGEVCFPGGSYDEEDGNLETTALRETFEEIGIPKQQIEIITNITDLYIPPSNFLVTPFIGICKHAPDFTPDPREVESVINVPVALLLDETIVKSKRIPVKSAGGLEMDAPYFDIFGKHVWGATAGILSEIKMMLSTFSRL